MSSFGLLFSFASYPTWALSSKGICDRNRRSANLNSIANRRIANHSGLFVISDKPPDYNTIYPNANRQLSPGSNRITVTPANPPAYPTVIQNSMHIHSNNRMNYPAVTRIDAWFLSSSLKKQP